MIPFENANKAAGFLLLNGWLQMADLFTWISPEKNCRAKIVGESGTESVAIIIWQHRRRRQHSPSPTN